MPRKETENIANRNFANEMVGFDTASATDMTGLTPTPARNAYEASSYMDIMPYKPPMIPYSTFPVTDAPVGCANPYKFKENFPDIDITKLCREGKKRV